MKIEEIDYYIYIDYSENLVGYNIIGKDKIPLILPKVVKFRHYKEERHKKIYLLKIKREIKSSDLSALLLKQKIEHTKDNLIIFTEIIEFIKRHDDCLIFISIDDNQFNAFVKLLEMIPHKSSLIVRKESELKKKSMEHKMSLIIDTMLNIERVSK